MTTTGLIIKVSTVTLFIAEMAAVFNRSRDYRRKKEPFFFIAVIGILCLKILLPDLDYVRELSVVGILFAAEHYLSAILPHKREGIFNFSCFGVMFVTLVVIPAGFYGSFSYRLFHTLACACLAVPVFLLMIRLARTLGKPSILFIAAASLAALAAGGVESFIHVLPADGLLLRDVFLLVLAAAVGYLIFEEGYFIGVSLRSLASRLNEEMRRSNEVSHRLFATEESLIARDRLVSLGTLAGGLTHEFKNILSLISNCAQYGLIHDSIERKNQSLELIREHVDHSMESVIRVLGRIKSQQAAEAKEIDIPSFLEHVCRIVRANYRTSGVDISLVLRSGFRTLARRDDLEQILLNLIRNAVNALCAKKDMSAAKITIVAFHEAGRGTIEVRDNAGGVNEAEAVRLFELHHDSSSPNGLGLYLTRLLAEQNGLTLRYSSSEGESCFSILFPEGETAEAETRRRTEEARPVFSG